MALLKSDHLLQLANEGSIFLLFVDIWYNNITQITEAFSWLEPLWEHVAVGE